MMQQQKKLTFLVWSATVFCILASFVLVLWVGPLVHAADGANVSSFYGKTSFTINGPSVGTTTKTNLQFDDGVYMIVFAGQNGVVGTGANGYGATGLAFYKGSGYEGQLLGSNFGRSNGGRGVMGGGYTNAYSNFALPEGTAAGFAIAAGGGGGAGVGTSEGASGSGKIGPGSVYWSSQALAHAVFYQSTAKRIQGAEGAPASQKGNGSRGGKIVYNNGAWVTAAASYPANVQDGFTVALAYTAGGGFNFVTSGGGGGYYAGGAGGWEHWNAASLNGGGGACSPNLYPIYAQDSVNGVKSAGNGFVAFYRIDPSELPQGNTVVHSIRDVQDGVEPITLTPANNVGAERYTPAAVGTARGYGNALNGIQTAWVYQKEDGTWTTDENEVALTKAGSRDVKCRYVIYATGNTDKIGATYKMKYTDPLDAAEDDNYVITETTVNLTLDVRGTLLTAPTLSINEFIFNGEVQNYFDGNTFDPATMGITYYQGETTLTSAPIEAGDYRVKFWCKDEYSGFTVNNQPEIEFSFAIKPAEIVSVGRQINSWLEEQITGGGQKRNITLTQKQDGKFVNFDWVKSKALTIYATMPIPYEGDTKPARPEFSLSNGTYLDVTNVDSNDPTSPLSVETNRKARYIVYFFIEAESHTPYEGEWRVEVSADSEVVKIQFVKPLQYEYGEDLDAAEVFKRLTAKENGYLEITKGGVDFFDEFFHKTGDQYNHVTGVRLGLVKKNAYGSYDAGNYYIAFDLPSDGIYNVIYRKSNEDEDTNLDVLVIRKKQLHITWDYSKLVQNYNGVPIIISDLATIDEGGVVDGNPRLNFTLEDGGQFITGPGEYKILLTLTGANAENYYIDDAVASATIMVSETTPTADDDDNGGIAIWIWFVGLILLLALIVVVLMAFIIKQRNSKRVGKNANENTTENKSKKSAE